MKERQERAVIFGLLLLTVLLGMWLRFRAPVPEWLRDGSGGALYVVCWMLAAKLVYPPVRDFPVAWIALVATCAVEFSQAWHVSWLDAARATVPGRLVLGTTFDWHDFPPYFVGAFIGWALLRALRANR